MAIKKRSLITPDMLSRMDLGLKVDKEITSEANPNARVVPRDIFSWTAFVQVPV